MKKVILSFCVVLLAVMAVAQAKITLVDKINPTDEVFMDMAVTAAQKSVSQQGKPEGAVIILNGAWRATGLPTAGKTVEEAAFAKSRLNSLKNATVYTVNQPTVAALNALNAAGVEAVYFANPADDVIAAGIFTAEDYDTAALDTAFVQAPLRQVPYAPAAALLKK